MEKTKKSIFSKIFVCLSLCLVLLGALAPCFSMNKNQQLRADSYEDGPVQFVGSEVWFPYDYTYFDVISDTNKVIISGSYDYSVNGPYISSFDGPITIFDPSWLILNVQISFSVDENNQLYFNYPFPVASDPLGDGKGGYYFDNSFIYKQANRFLVSEFNSKVIYFQVSSMPYNFAVKTYFEYSSLFDYTNVISVNLFSGSDVSGKFVYVRYNDANNYSLRIAFYVAENFDFPSRTYYFKETVNLTDNQFYNLGYESGKVDGYNSGFSAGTTNGYNDGYKAGNTIGFENGYNKGVNDSNQYTFINLIGATIDAPIKYFQSLFNFELLGINLSSFLMGLFTLCIVVTIVKLCLGR